MSPAALSVRIYSGYVTLLGAFFVFLPASTGSAFGLAPDAIRWVGALLVVFGILLRQGTDHDDAWLIRSSIWMRLVLGAVLIVVAVQHDATNLLLLAAVEFGSSLWTRVASTRHWQ